MSFSMPRLVSVVILGSLLACSGTSPDRDAEAAPAVVVPIPNGGEAAPDGGSPAEQDAAASKDVATDEPTLVGTVAVWPSANIGRLAPGTGASAAFLPKDFALSGCTPYQTMGACDVRTCAGPVSPKAPLVDAGTITISGAGETLPLFSQSGSYTSANNQNMTWTAGALFSVTATGAAGGVPAFTASVSVPASLDLVSPTVLTDVSRSNDLTMEWTGDEAGTNAMAFIQSPSLSARCTVPSSSHKVVVPQAVLALAPPSESGQVFLRASRTQTLRTGSAQVDVTAFVNRGSWNVTFH